MSSRILEQYHRCLWDFDGTLFELDVDWSMLKQRLAALDHRIIPGDLNSMLGIASRLGLRENALRLVAEAELAGMSDMRNVRHPAFEIFRGVTKKSMIVSNNISSTIQAFLDGTAVQILGWATRDMVANPKPALDAVLTLKEHWQGHSVICIGDSDVDRQMALAAEFDFVHVDELRET